MRPHIVWFGEAVPLIPKAINICESADVLLIIGTSLQVYPAASLMHYVHPGTKIFYVDPKPAIESTDQLTVIAEKATVGLERIKSLLI